MSGNGRYNRSELRRMLEKGIRGGSLYAKKNLTMGKN